MENDEECRRFLRKSICSISDFVLYCPRLQIERAICGEDCTALLSKDGRYPHTDESCVVNPDLVGSGTFSRAGVLEFTMELQVCVILNCLSAKLSDLRSLWPLSKQYCTLRTVS